MRFADIHIDGFGKFQDVSFSFDQGINVLYGENEAGKSTLHTFLRAMLFGLSKRPSGGKKPPYESFRPWRKDAAFGGSMRIEHQGRFYRIQRNFARDAEDLSILEEESGALLSEPRQFLSEALAGLTETGYVNTISIGQLRSAAGPGAAAELRKYIANLNTTGSAQLSAEAARAYLEDQKKSFQDRLQPEAARQYARAVSEVKNLEAELSRPENENRLAAFREQREQMQSGIAALSAERTLLSEKLEKARGTLTENRFTDEASVKSYEQETRDVFADYERAKGLAEKKLRKVLPPVLILGAVLAGLAGLLGAGVLEQTGMLQAAGLELSGLRQLPLPPAAFFGAAAVFLAAGIGLLCLNRRNRRIYRHTGSLLSEILKNHTGQEAVSQEAMELFSERMEGYAKLCRTAEAYEGELKTLSERLLQLGEEQTACQARIEEQQEIQLVVEQKLMELSHYRTQVEEYRKILSENERIQTELEAIGIAQETLEALGKAIRESLGAYLNQEASRLLRQITGGAYQSMDVGRSLEICLNTKDRLIPLESVSSGTMDQIYLAVRLAAVRLIQGGGETLPLLFDDSFALYDDGRLAHALEFLAGHYGGQILLFTCHHREERLLSKNRTPYKMIYLKKEPQDLGGRKKLEENI